MVRTSVPWSMLEPPLPGWWWKARETPEHVLAVKRSAFLGTLPGAGWGRLRGLGRVSGGWARLYGGVGVSIVGALSNVRWKSSRYGELQATLYYACVDCGEIRLHFAQVVG